MFIIVLELKKKKKQIKFLGVCIDKNLIYKYYKDYIGFKISEVFGIIVNLFFKNFN